MDLLGKPTPININTAPREVILAAIDGIDLGMNFARGNWTLAAGLANATNEKGVLSVTGAPAGVGNFAQYFLQRPRTLTVSLRYDY